MKFMRVEAWINSHICEFNSETKIFWSYGSKLQMWSLSKSTLTVSDLRFSSCCTKQHIYMIKTQNNCGTLLTFFVVVVSSHTNDKNNTHSSAVRHIFIWMSLIIQMIQMRIMQKRVGSMLPQSPFWKKWKKSHL